MAKSNNKLYVGIAAVAAVVIAIVGIIVAAGGGNNNGGGSGDNGGNSNNGSNNGTTQSSGLSASDLENIDVVVEYGDYDTMYELSKDIQNGEATGEVVKIDGDVSYSGTTYSIVQQNEAGTGNSGPRFIIEGEADYPNDKDHVIITGKVVELEPLVYIIETLPEFIEIQD